jgi:hypothetical protein
MAYNYNTFLRPLNTGDKNILIFNESGELVYTVNPFSVTNTQVRGNIITISVKSGRTILLDFLNSNFAKVALPILQSRIYTLTENTPNFIDKQIDKWSEANTIQRLGVILSTATATGLSPSTYNLNFDDGSIFYIEPEGDDFVANYLNVPTTDNRIISTTIIITQTASAYIPDTVIINGDFIPISWSNGSLPTGNANQTDIVGFSFMRIGATWSKVFGQLSTFNTI